MGSAVQERALGVELYQCLKPGLTEPLEVSEADSSKWKVYGAGGERLSMTFLVNLLAEKGMYVETLITIATPVREYKLETKVGQHIQMNNNRDSEIVINPKK
ncbi:hypothetical protein PAECIP111892_02950 [Paenibacillus auburnensis]|uniref:Uncharacterized protein n=1 Tax=Paenibacillus auburnensis TaxID=2905649 RepID=A0ABM9CAG0_9BACL|nr:hypothetical protein [Paenibacillus auburnensis]CAH1207638.1 hypothetical protein PAECIP111892_02950 [Paenibacillus auburnensis]